MTMDEIISFVGGLDGVVSLMPAAGDGSPELSWGDAFFYYAPDGVIPATAQPFATVVTKDYEGDEASRLDRPDTFRVNIAAGREAFVRWTGYAPGESATSEVDPSTADIVIAHPIYGVLGWLAVVNPGTRTETVTRELLSTAHQHARSRHERRAGVGQSRSSAQ